MTKQEIFRESFLRRLKDYENKKYFEKEKLDKETSEIALQIKLMQQESIINAATTNYYVSRIKKKYMDTLHQKQFQEFREQVINFNDDFITSREYEFMTRESEIKSIQSMNKWKKEIAISTSSSDGGNGNEDIDINKDNEHEDNKDNIYV